jgi:hypothetical protein
VAGYNGSIINYLFKQDIYRVGKANGSNIKEDLMITGLTQLK